MDAEEPVLVSAPVPVRMNAKVAQEPTHQPDVVLRIAPVVVEELVPDSGLRITKKVIGVRECIRI